MGGNPPWIRAKEKAVFPPPPSQKGHSMSDFLVGWGGGGGVTMKNPFFFREVRFVEVSLRGGQSIYGDFMLLNLLFSTRRKFFFFFFFFSRGGGVVVREKKKGANPEILTGKKIFESNERKANKKKKDGSRAKRAGSVFANWGMVAAPFSFECFSSLSLTEIGNL